MSQPTQTPQNHGRFNIPTEHRLQIYTYALTTASGYICFCTSRHRLEEHLDSLRRGMSLQMRDALEQDILPRRSMLAQHEAASHRSPNLVLLLTCRQINREARDVVFEVNTFLLALGPRRPASEVTRPSLEIHIPAPIRAKVRHVFLHIWMDANDSIEEILSVIRSLGGLQSLRMTMCYAVEVPRGGNVFARRCCRTIEAVVDHTPSAAEILFGAPRDGEEELVESFGHAPLPFPLGAGWSAIDLTADEMERAAKPAMERRATQRTKLLAWFKTH